jgi:serine/threonine-protein kinase
LITAARVAGPTTSDSEEARAFLQARVALFWQVIFFIILFGSVLGGLGAVKAPGPDLLVTLASAANAGIFWWLCRRGTRSIRFSRTMESVGLLLNSAIGALTSRYILDGFAGDHALAGGQAVTIADGYVSMLQLFGMAMMVAIRAALVPSSPRRTAIITAAFVLPMILVTTLVVPAGGSSLAWRAVDSDAYPWLPGTIVMMWVFTLITCTVISWVIYGLRAEVREARRLGQYVLERKIGEGGMGQVYRARHGMMRRPTAIKLLRADRSGDIDLGRFEREVQLTARLTHPNTITIFDYGRTQDGVFYYAMELLDGATLQRIVTVDGAQPVARVVRILKMVCGALAEAHAIGLIHRDIKPANIMLCMQGGERDVVKLLDFGLVKEIAVDRRVELTAASMVVGTPQYMAPESIRDPGSVDGRADIYAVGAVAYYLLAGVDVFDGKSVMEICGQHLHQPPTPLSARGFEIPPELEAVVLACLEKDPDRRPQSASELQRRIDACALDSAGSWDAAAAAAWWREFQPDLDAAARQSSGDVVTIAVDGALRARAGIRRE